MNTKPVKSNRRTLPTAHRERGAVLFIALMMLLTMTLVGVTGLQSTTMQEKMSGNMRDINLSFQAAEAALREGETFLEAATLPDFNGGSGLHQPEPVGSPPVWEVESNWSGARTYSGSLAYVSEAPKFMIEELAPVPDPEGSLAADEPLPDTTIYRVTSRGLGGSSTSLTILQGTFKR